MRACSNGPWGEPQGDKVRQGGQRFLGRPLGRALTGCAFAGRWYRLEIV